MRVYSDDDDESYFYEASHEEEILIRAYSLVSTGRCQELPDCMFTEMDLIHSGIEIDVATFLQNFEVY